MKKLTFCIVAHIDHGKSTLSDQFLILCQNINYKFHSQFLDSMEIEKKRCVTVKLHCVRLKFHNKQNDENYILNLLDSPGHIDFSTDVEIALQISDVIILLIDVMQGIQAQTISHANEIKKLKKHVVIVLNKIDLISDKNYLNKLIKEIKNFMFNIVYYKEDLNNVFLISSKSGEGVLDLIKFLTCSYAKKENKALNSDEIKLQIIDSFFDKFYGIAIMCKVLTGEVYKNTKLYLSHSNTKFKVVKLGVPIPQTIPIDCLKCNDIGVIFTNLNIDNISDIIPTTYITSYNTTPLNKISKLDKSSFFKPKVFCNIFPFNTSEFNVFLSGVKKYSLKDSGFTYKVYSSKLLGNGVQCGFLGNFHMIIVKERLQEIGVEFFFGKPFVELFNLKSKSIIENANEIKHNELNSIQIKYCKTRIISPQSVSGQIKHFLNSKIPGIKNYNEEINNSLNFINQDNTCLTTLDIPFMYTNDLLNKIKKVSNGLGNLTFIEFFFDSPDFKKQPLGKLEISINNEIIPLFTSIVFIEDAHEVSKNLCETISKFVSRKQFKIVINGILNGKKITRSDINPFRKDVLAKALSGRDVSRKNKLLQKQKAGKKRLLNVKHNSSSFINRDDWVNILNNDQN